MPTQGGTFVKPTVKVHETELLILSHFYYNSGSFDNLFANNILVFETKVMNTVFERLMSWGIVFDILFLFSIQNKEKPHLY